MKGLGFGDSPLQLDPFLPRRRVVAYQYERRVAKIAAYQYEKRE